jgi:hypothetical protein
VNRSLGAIACIGLVSLLGGCGGGVNNDLLSETGVRECLAKAQIGPRTAQSSGSEWTGYAPIFVPDFTAYASDGTPVAVIVQGSSKRAQETAAHVRSAFASLGGAVGGGQRVIATRNAVAVFARAPSAAVRSSVRSCLAG